MKLSGQHIFVTGGADGIGAACVLDAAQAGARVSYCDINVEKGKAYEAELTAQGFETYFVKADVSNMADFTRGHSEVVNKFGDVTGLVSNAGRNAYFDPVEMTEEQWIEFMNLDLKSVWVGAKLVLPAMRAKKKSCKLIQATSKSSKKRNSGRAVMGNQLAASPPRVCSTLSRLKIKRETTAS